MGDEQAWLRSHDLRIPRSGDTIIAPSVPKYRSIHMRRLFRVFLIGGARDW